MRLDTGQPLRVMIASGRLGFCSNNFLKSSVNLINNTGTFCLVCMDVKNQPNEPEIIARSYSELYAKYRELLSEFRERKEINKLLLEATPFL